MRAPQDVTEGSGVGLGKEEGGMIPLGEQLTVAPTPLAFPALGLGVRGSHSCPSFICSGLELGMNQTPPFHAPLHWRAALPAI